MTAQLTQTFAGLVNASFGVNFFRDVELGEGTPDCIRLTAKGGIDENARRVAVDASADLQAKCRNARKLIGGSHPTEAQLESVFE